MIGVLVTGVGGPLGQALVKAARQSSVACRIVGTDRTDLSVGLHWVDKGFVLPDAGQEHSYLDHIRRVCSSEGIQAVLPGSDRELELLSRHAANVQRETGAVVVASPPPVLDIALSKWETSRFLERVGLNFPRSAMLSSEADVERLIARFGFPLIAKPCRGSGSRGLFQVRSRADVAYIRTLGNTMLLQEYLRPDDEEYTVAIFTARDGGPVGGIVMRRELVAGNTYRAWVVEHAEVQDEAQRVVKALGPLGPCNVQLRRTERGPVTFEINPRFSGTTAMRAHFGYNEVEMALRNLVLGERLSPPKVRHGIALRFWDEMYVEGTGNGA